MKTDNSNDELLIEVLQLRKAPLIFRATNHKLRQQILRLIHQNKRMIVTDIYAKLRLEQSVASQHLAILRKSYLVITQRDGKFIYYSVNYKTLEAIHQYAGQLTGVNS
jgi:DNA-binding transcriptional ArsR family regulator